MVDAHYNLANLYLEKENYHLAAVHYRSSLELRPNWDKAQHGLEQSELGLAAQTEAAGTTPHPSPAAKTIEEPAKAPVATLDPNRMVDPNVHGNLLSTLHKATIESETHGREFLQILESAIEPAIKELSTCLLYPNSSANELDECVHKFEVAINSMHNAQRSLQSSIERIRSLGDRLLKS